MLANKATILYVMEMEISKYRKRQKHAKLSIRNNEIDKILDRINNKSKPRVVIGVRPSGFSDFESIRSKLEYREMQFGYEPIEKDLEIKFPKQDLKS